MRIASCIMTLFLLLALPLKSQDPQTHILSRDIGKSITIIGALGVPIGEMVTIEGRAKESQTLNFVVTKINGVPLPKPIEIWVNGGVSLPGLVSLEGYEIAGYEGIPPEVCKKLNFKPHQPWGFYVRFDVTHESKVAP